MWVRTWAWCSRAIPQACWHAWCLAGDGFHAHAAFILRLVRGPLLAVGAVADCVYLPPIVQNTFISLNNVRNGARKLCGRTRPGSEATSPKERGVKESRDIVGPRERTPGTPVWNDASTISEARPANTIVNEMGVKPFKFWTRDVFCTQPALQNTSQITAVGAKKGRCYPACCYSPMLCMPRSVTHGRCVLHRRRQSAVSMRSVPVLASLTAIWTWSEENRPPAVLCALVSSCPVTQHHTIKTGFNDFVLDSRRVLHPAPGT